jgi:membrane protein YdbS with pleckstrin-like domain
VTDDADQPAPVRALDPEPGEWLRVSPKYIVVDLVGTVVGGLMATVATGIPYLLTQEPLWLIPPAFFFLMMIVSGALTPRRVRSIGYRLRADDLLFRRGIMFQRFVAVPYGRMQLVDITRGPVARAVGLADLKLVTAAAASNVLIPGLTLESAEQLRDQLVELAETRRAGL